MSKNQPGKTIVKEHSRGPSGSCGFETTMWRQKDRERGGAVILLRGGLGDTHSVSLVPLAHALIKASDGEFIVGTAGTVRPTSPIRAVDGARNARRERSMSFYGAAKRVRDVYEPRVMVAGGQSEGGVTVADGVLHWHTKAKNPGQIPRTGVVTIDTPGVHEPMPTEKGLLGELMRLGGNCMKDFRHVSPMGWISLIASRVEHGISPWELAYLKGEVDYLRNNIDISPVLADLRSLQVAVRHAFHRDDSVPGAEVINEHSEVFEGAHVRVLWEPEPVAQYIVGITTSMLDVPHEAAA